MISIENVSEKLRAIAVAESCIHSCLSVNPNAVDSQTFVALNEIKMLLLDLQDAQDIEML